MSTATASKVVSMAAAGDTTKLVSSFAFTNSTAGKSVATTNVGLVSNYARIMDEPTEARLNNLTAPVDQGELVTLRCRKVARVATEQQIMYPARVEAGVEYGIRIDEILRTVDPNGVIICDEPIVASITIKHPLSSNISDEIVTQVFTRLLGACYDQTNSKYRWGDLMRQALLPTSD